jgi:hypothetical protein
MKGDHVVAWSALSLRSFARVGEFLWASKYQDHEEKRRCCRTFLTVTIMKIPGSARSLRELEPENNQPTS